MKAVYFLGGRHIEIRDVPDPTPGPGEVVLEIKASGMCGSDLKFYRIVGGAAALGLPGAGDPVIGGHEPCSVVVEVGRGVSDKQARVGMRVMNHHYHGCGSCRHCTTGWSQMCDDGALVYARLTAVRHLRPGLRQLNAQELTLHGSWTFSKTGQADCARFVTDRRVDVGALFTRSWPLSEAVAAYELFDTQTTGKGVLIPE